MTLLQTGLCEESEQTGLRGQLEGEEQEEGAPSDRKLKVCICGRGS